MKKPSHVTKTSSLPWAFAPVEAPTFAQSLKFPENLPALSGRDLGLYHGQFTSLLAFARSELSKVVVDILKIESEISRQRHQRIIMSTESVKWQLESMVESNPLIIDLRKKELHAKIQKETLSSYADNFERYASALSREMTRRASEQRVLGA